MVLGLSLGEMQRPASWPNAYCRLDTQLRKYPDMHGSGGYRTYRDGPSGTRGGSQSNTLADRRFRRPLRHWQAGDCPGNPESIAPSVGPTVGPGHHGRAAVLTYRLPCDANIGCGAEAAAIWRSASPLPKRRDPAISWWIRAAPDVEVFLLARDTTGQTLQFPMVATIEHAATDLARELAREVFHRPL